MRSDLKNSELSANSATLKIIDYVRAYGLQRWNTITILNNLCMIKAGA